MIDISKLYYMNRRHQEAFNYALEKYDCTPDKCDDRTALLYLLTAIWNDNLSVLDSIIYTEPFFSIKKDIFANSTFSSGEAQLLRLAINLFSWRAPTATLNGSVDVDEFERYLPINIFSGLSESYFRAGIEAIYIKCARWTM